MTVGNLLDIMRVEERNKIVLLDLSEMNRGDETKVSTKAHGWSYQPYGYKEFSSREVYGVHVIGNKIMISMS